MLTSNRIGPLWRILSLIEGEDGAAGGSGGGGTRPEFTADQHAEVNRIVQAREAEAARKAAAAEQTRIAEYLAAEKSKVDIANLEGEARAKAETAAAVARAEAAEAKVLDAQATAALTTVQADARLALNGAGMPAATVTDGLALLGVVADDDGAAIAAKVEALKTRIPALFAEAVAPPSGYRPPPAATPPGATGGAGLTREQKAQAIYQPRFGHKQPAA